MRWTFWLAAAAVLLPACERAGGPSPGSGPGGEGEDGKVRVVATTGMVADLVRNVGADRVDVRALMGPGVDPHLYKASEGDVRRMSEARIVFYNGLHLEGKMTYVFEKMGGRIRTVAVTSAIDPSLLLAPPQFQGAHDPHVWFDVSLWMRTVEPVRSALSDADPDHAPLYRANADAYREKLGELHEEVRRRAGELPESKRVLITAHDAFNYFGRAYGFEVRGLQGISTATEAGTADVQALSAFIAQREIPAIFVESSVPRRSVEALQAAARARGFAVDIGGQLYSDALGPAGTPEGTYTGMVRYNIETIVKALSRSAPD
ncbi:MAG: zinc ABC transporter substrate-binding protein [bacterium]